RPAPRPERRLRPAPRGEGVGPGAGRASAGGERGRAGLLTAAPQACCSSGHWSGGRRGLREGRAGPPSSGSPERSPLCLFPRNREGRETRVRPRRLLPDVGVRCLAFLARCPEGSARLSVTCCRVPGWRSEVSAPPPVPACGARRSRVPESALREQGGRLVQVRGAGRRAVTGRRRAASLSRCAPRCLLPRGVSTGPSGLLGVSLGGRL
ncbi:hypothetical protein MC885_020713, partial [Smutsia gigantea]